MAGKYMNLVAASFAQPLPITHLPSALTVPFVVMQINVFGLS
jgi:hypothetical protein